MQVLIDETCARYDAPAWYRNALWKSFDNMFIDHNGRPRHVLGTLMSGHRGTSFINSVLNAAYIRAAVGGAHFDGMVSLHAGDDVYIRSRTLAEAAYLLQACAKFGCRMNPTKQSIGFHHAEFLRLGIGTSEAHGYLARSIATLVAGTWTADDPLTPEQGLTSAITTVGSVTNRGGSPMIPRLVARSYASIHGYKLRDLDRLLTGTWAIAGAPVYNVDYQIRTYKVERPPPTPTRDILPPGHGEHATRSYLELHVTPLEAEAIKASRADLTALMLGSSYSKGIVPRHDQLTVQQRPRLVPRPPRLAKGFIEAAELYERPPEVGILASYPLLRLIEGRLDDDTIRYLVTMAGGNGQARDIRVAAFGPEGHSCNVIGILPYSDASSYSRRTTSDNIIARYPVYS